MSILTIVQKVARRSQYPEPQVAVTSTDDRIKQMVAFAEEEGAELVLEHRWQVLRKEHTFTTLAQQEQAGAIPADAEFLIPETFFNRTETRRVVGPLSAEEWQAEQAIIATVLRDSFMVRGGVFLMHPVPPAGQTIAYEYQSGNWINNKTAKTFSTDADAPDLDEEMITLGTQWRFLSAIGQDYAEVFQKYQVRKARLKSKDGTARVITLDERPLDWQKARVPYTSEGNWLV